MNTPSSPSGSALNTALPLLRFIPRGFRPTADPILGFAVSGTTQPFVAEALYEVVLYPDGSATWRIVQERSSLAEQPSGYHPNGHTFDHLYATGLAGPACFPDLLAPSLPGQEG